MSAETQHRYQPGSARELLMVALPLMVSFGSQSLISFVDRMLLTWHSNSALAATMPAGMLNWTIISFALGVANYTGTFVAQYEGAGRKDRVAGVVWQSIWICLVFGSALATCSLAAPWIFALADHPPDVQRNEVIYFSTLCLGTPAVLLVNALSGFFAGRSRTAIVMWVNLFAVVINLGLDAVLIFGAGPIPAQGIFGAAIATVCANIMATLLFAGILIVHCRRDGYPLWSKLGLDLELCGRMIWYGVPVGLQIFVDLFGYTTFLFFVGKLGTAELAATNLAFNLNSLAFIPMLGLGTGVMTLVGRRVGEGLPALAEATVRHAVVLGMTYMGIWCIAYLFLPRLLISPFSAYAAGADFEQIEATAIVLLRFIAVYGMFDVFGIVYAYAIRGAGDAVFPFLFFLFASIFVLVIPSAVLWIYWGGNLYASWVIVTSYIVLVGVVMYARYRQGKWKQMSVIESQPVLD